MFGKLQSDRLVSQFVPETRKPLETQSSKKSLLIETSDVVMRSCRNLKEASREKTRKESIQELPVVDKENQ